jgi:hypothetical protein
MYNLKMSKQLFQTSNSLQQSIAISLFVTMIILSNISYVHAESDCSLSIEVPIAGLNCWFKTDIERLVRESSQKYISKEAELHFGKMVDYMAQTLPKTAKFRQEFKAMLKSLFEKKIIFLLKDIDKVLNSITLNKSIEAIIEDELTRVDRLILNTFQQYNQVANDPNQKIKLHKNRSIELDRLRQKFRQEISRFLDESKYFSKRVNCAVEATLDPISQNRQLRNKDFSAKMAPFSLDITSMATGTPLPIASAKGNLVIESKKEEEAPHLKSIAEPIFCYQQLGLKAPPETWEYSTVYDLKKCKILNTLTPETPTKRILNVYVDLKAWAAKIACIQHGAGYHATQHYIWDWLEFGYLYNLWYHYQ